MACSIRSITLQPGESYVLPAGAQIIGATDSAGITSVNDCAGDLDNLETPICYAFRFSGALDDDGGRTENWDNANYFVNGITLNNVYYPFVSPISGTSGTATFQAALNSISALSGLFTSISAAYGEDSVFLGASRGWSTILTLNAIPSIGDNLQFEISTVTIDQIVVPNGSSTLASVSGEPCV